MSFTPRIAALASVLALAACELPTKLGNLSDSDSDTATETTADTTIGGTESASSDSDGTTGKPDEPSTTTGFDPSETTGVGMTATASPSTTGDTGVPADCELLDEAACLASDCRALYGVAYDFPGCSEGQVYLGCVVDMGCPESETNYCKDGTEEAYRRPDGCQPPGFIECEPSTLAYCGSCEALSEAECILDFDVCGPIYGAPHVEMDGEMCVDYESQQFLACAAEGGACPPFVPTICPIDKPDEAYDSPSGCIPKGYEECDGAGTPQCS